MHWLNSFLFSFLFESAYHDALRDGPNLATHASSIAVGDAAGVDYLGGGHSDDLLFPV